MLQLNVLVLVEKLALSILFMTTTHGCLSLKVLLLTVLSQLRYLPIESLQHLVFRLEHIIQLCLLRDGLVDFGRLPLKLKLHARVLLLEAS